MVAKVIVLYPTNSAQRPIPWSVPGYHCAHNWIRSNKLFMVFLLAIFSGPDFALIGVKRSGWVLVQHA